MPASVEPARRLLALYWRPFVTVVTPLALLPILLLYSSKEARCAYVVLVMAVYWMTEAIAVSVTALVPIALFPLLGVASTSDVCFQYLKDTNIMFISGLIIAIAVEHCDLHRRVGLLVLLAVRGNPKFLLLGVMGTTMFLSMWISNLAATAMMLPIAFATLDVLGKFDVQNDGAAEHLNNDDGKAADGKAAGDAEEGRRRQSVVSSRLEEQKDSPTKREVAYMLAIAYASSIGGCGTLTGSGPNLVYIGILGNTYDETDVTYATWIAFNFLPMVLATFFTWIWLQWLFLGFKWKTTTVDQQKRSALQTVIREQYESMGPMTFHQLMTTVLFLLVVMLWFMRDPKFIPGWDRFFEPKSIKDGTPGILVVLLLFIIPCNLDFVGAIRRGEVDTLKTTPSMLSWKVVEKKLPWGVIILMGGSYAMSLGFKESGLSDAIGKQLEVVDALDPFFMVLVVVFVSMLITEVAANTAVATILLPVMNNVALALRINPIYLTLPCAVSSSYAFMFPVGTPPNALVAASSKKLQTKDMIKAGVVTKVICAVVLIIFLNTLGYLIFGGARDFPEWASQVQSMGSLAVADLPSSTANYTTPVPGPES